MARRVVVISGAGRGIGRATALAFGAAGDQVVLAARSADALALVAAAVEQAGGAALAYPCDVTDEAQVRALIAAAVERAGRIDVVVCGAGGAVVAPFEQLSLEQWERTVRVSLTGTFLLCREAVRHMGRGGHLFTIASIAGRSGFPTWSAYSAAKFGVIGFSQAIREELRPRGIRVTTVIPGAVDTPLWEGIPGEWNRAAMLQPEDVARAILRAADEPAHVSIDEVVIGHIVGKL
ncbi:SDR family oxidoreductase [Kallotenue papyrolyticum]|uniref:SDR family oxidoreductase n=1 Tax=Kallotenue papyrolyticum TaxID=1325125 RepID=UPI0004785EDF|nr:SDR family oxidoreductase [Kallotenue papyrolyticum]